MEGYKTLFLLSQNILKNDKDSAVFQTQLGKEIDCFLNFSDTEFISLALSTPVINDTMRALVEIIQSDFISLQLLTKLFNFLIRISMNNNNFLLMKLIGKNESLRDLMVTDCKLISNLISFFSNYKNEYIFECLMLLQYLSRQKSFVSLHCQFCENILKYCLSVILSGEISNVQLLLCLELIINICKENVTMQIRLKHISDYEPFQHKLISLVSDKSVSTIVTSLHLLAILCLKCPLGKKIFKPCNIDQTLQLTLSIICTSNDATTVAHAVDLLLLLLTSLQHFQDTMAQYCQFKDFLQKVFRRLAEANGQIANKILELACVISSISQFIPDIVSVLFKQGRQKVVLKSLFELLEEQSLLYTDAVSTGLTFLSTLVKLPQVMEILTHDVSIVENILTVIQSYLDTINYKLDDNTLFYLITKQRKSLQILMDLADLNLCLKKDFVIALEQLVQDQLAHNTLFTNHEKNRWSAVGVSASVTAIAILCKLSFEDKTHLHLDSTCFLKDKKILLVLSYAICEGDKKDVMSALSALLHIAHGYTSVILESLSEVLLSTKEKYNVLYYNCFASFLPESGHTTRPSNEGSDNSRQIEVLVDKFKSGLQIEDIPASEIMNVYEHKLQEMKARQSYLQDLLDAKSQAMSHTNQLLEQYRSKMAHCESECQKLTALLQNTEKHCEIMKDKIDHLESERTQLLLVVEDHSKLTLAHQEQTKWLKETKNKLLEAKEQLHNQAIMQEKAQLEAETQLNIKKKELEDLQQQYNDCRICLEDVKTKNQELLIIIKEQESNLSVIANAKQDLEASVDRLSHSLTTTEERSKVLSERVTILEGDKFNLEALTENLKQSECKLRKEISELKTEVDLFSAVKNLINQGNC